MIIADKDSIGKSEVYWEFFKCPNCEDESISTSFNFCPGCGQPLEWQISEDFNYGEVVTIRSGKLAGVKGSVYDYNRKSGMVVLRIDDTNNVTIDYNNVIRKNAYVVEKKEI